MVNPGAFQGSRKEFLIGEKAAYSVAVNEGYVADAVALIQRRYLKRFPIDLPHTEEPSPEHLAAVDDNAPVPEPEEPNRENMSEFEYKMAVAEAKNHQSLLDYRKGQIKRWLAYQYMKDNNGRPKETGAYSPYTILMQKLTGKEVSRPRQRSAVNIWRKTQREHIEDHLKAEIELGKRLGKEIKKDQYAAVRDKIARELFADLDEGVRRSWGEQARAEHKAALEEYNIEMAGGPSTEPADRQRAIQGLVQFMQPILNMVGRGTGWKLSLLAGGPEPAHGGRLSVISIHSGYTSGDIKMTFGRAERVRYKKHVVPMFGNFLQMCYTPEECRSRALPENQGFLPMSSLETDNDEITFDTINTTSSSTSALALSPTTTQPPHPFDRPLQNLSEQCADRNDGQDSQQAQNTDDSLSPSNTNPFPFEHVDEEVQAITPPRSPLLSPPCSPPRSPISPTAITDPNLQATTLPMPIHPSLRTALSHQNPPTSRITSDSGDMRAVSISGTCASNNSQIRIEKDPIVTKKRKHSVRDVLAAVQPGSKRIRTKTTRAIAAEEQNLIGKKGKSSGGLTAKKPVPKGKENRPPKKNTEPSSKRIQKKRRT